MPRLRLTAVLLLTACAPGPRTGSPPAAPPMPAHILKDPGGEAWVVTSAAGEPIGASFAVSPEKAWPVASSAYARVGLRVDASDPTRHIVETRAMQLRRRLNGIALSTYFNCGMEMTGLIADSWVLTLNGRMTITPAATADSSLVRTTLTVLARPLEGSSASATACSSTGRLETQLAAAIAAALAAQRP